MLREAQARSVIFLVNYMEGELLGTKLKRKFLSHLHLVTYVSEHVFGRPTPVSHGPFVRQGSS